MILYANLPPLVSVIIINWNHRHFLNNCLVALLNQTYAWIEILVIDNASHDGSAAWLMQHYPQVRLKTFTQNMGFSRAMNWGIQHSTGEFILSLNPDVVPRADFVAELMHVGSQAPRIGIVAPKLLRADQPQLLDSTGLFIDRQRRPYDRGQGEVDSGQYDEQLEIFGGCGAAVLYRRTMLADLLLVTGITFSSAAQSQFEVEYLDEDFFAYYEDADLAWRAQSRGWRAVYAPQAVATHVRGWGDTLFKPGHIVKNGSGARLALCNRYLMCLKNDAGIYFLLDAIRIFGAELPRLLYMLLANPHALLGLGDFLRLWPRALHKRRQINSRRQISPRATRHWFCELRVKNCHSEKL